MSLPGVFACPGTGSAGPGREQGSARRGSVPPAAEERKRRDTRGRAAAGPGGCPGRPMPHCGRGATFTEVFGVFPSKRAGGGARVREFPEPSGPAWGALQPRGGGGTAPLPRAGCGTRRPAREGLLALLPLPFSVSPRPAGWQGARHRAGVKSLGNLLPIPIPFHL